MTEAELKRLAEIIVELSPERSGFTFWQVVAGVFVGFVGGFLANATAKVVERWQARRESRRAALKSSRTKLYRALVAYQAAIQEQGKPPTNLRSYEDREANKQRIFKAIRSALDEAGDTEYGELLRKPIFGIWPPGSETQQLIEINKIILRLEPQALKVSERLHVEMFRSVGSVSRTAEARGLRKWLYKLREFIRRLGMLEPSSEPRADLGDASGGVLVKLARRLERILGKG